MSRFKRIPPQQARSLREQGAMVVDIRDPQSYAMGHISGSQHLDNYSLAAFIASAEHQTAVIVSCYHGNSSQSAAAYLSSQGFAEVYSLDGGFELWSSTFPAEISRLDPQSP